MATITSQQSGNWTDSATWAGGVVPSGANDIIIAAGHTVTLDADFRTQATVTLRGELALVSTFSVGGNISGRLTTGTLTAEAGAIFSGAGTLNFSGGWFHARGTAASPVRIQDSVVIQGGSGMTRLEWDHVLVTTTINLDINLSSGTNIYAPGYGIVRPGFIFNNVAFDGPKNVTLGTGGPIDTDYRLFKCEAREIERITLTGGSSLSPLGTGMGLREVDSCVFVNRESVGYLTLTAVVPAPEEWTVDNSVFINVLGGGGKTKYAASFFSGIKHGNYTVLENGVAGSSCVDSYMYLPAIGTPGYNMRMTLIETMIGSTLENEAAGPNVVRLTRPTANQSMVLEGVLGLGHGAFVGPVAAMTADISIINCSLVTRETSGTRPSTYALYDGGSSKVTPKTKGIEILNCLQVCMDAVTPDSSMVRAAGLSADPQNMDFDYSCKWGVTAFTPDAGITNSTGSSLTNADPEFVDPTRGLLRWATEVAGIAGATYEDVWDYFAALNGYDPIAKTWSTPSPLTPADLNEWVRDGYAPQNIAYISAGKDGWHVGAVLPVGDLPEEFADSIIVQQSGLPIGTAPDPSTRSSAIAPPSGWSISHVLAPPVVGIVEKRGDDWVYELLDPMPLDTFKLAITNAASQASGVLTVSVAAEKDPGVLHTPQSVSVTNESAAVPITFNAGAARPAETTFTIDGVAGVFNAGEVVRTPNAIIELIPDPLGKVTGPGAGGGIYCFATHPDYPELMFAACDMGGCYRSTDGGALWRIMNGINMLHSGPGPQIFPDGKTIVWPGKNNSGGTDKVMVSRDTGATWVNAGRLPIRSVPITGGTRYNTPTCAAPFAGGCLMGTKLDGLIFFDPNDFSFTTVDANMEIGPEGDPRGLWFLEAGDGSGYYVTGKDLRKFTYANGVFATETVYTASDYIVGFAHRGGTFLITIKDQGIFVSKDGTSWTKVRDYAYQYWLHITPLGTFYASVTSSGNFAAGDVFDVSLSQQANKPIYMSTDGGASWTGIFDISPAGNVERTWVQTQIEWSYYFMINSFTVLPGATQDEDIIYASSQGELFKTINGGKSWTCPYRIKTGDYQGLDRNKSIGLEVTSCWGLVEDIHDPNIWHAPWTDIAGQFSPDKGETWVCASTGVLQSSRNTLYGVAMHPGIPGLVWGAWAGTHDIPYDGYVSGTNKNGGIFKSTDYGLTWTQPYTPGVTGPALKDCTDVLFDPNTNALYAAVYGECYDFNDPGRVEAYQNYGIWKSMDLGATWTRKVNGLDPNNLGNLHVYRLKLGASGALYALITAYTSKDAPGGLYKSLDDGDSWVKIGPTGPAGSTWDYWPTAFTFGETENDIYVTAVDKKPGTVGLMVTHDGGATWEALWSKSVPGTYTEYCMSVYVDGDLIIMGGANSGPWLSWDGGASWTVWEDFPFYNIQSITKLRSGKLACTTFGAGIFIVDPPARNSGNLRPSSGVLKITRLTDAQQDLNITFAMTDKDGRETTTQTLVRLGSDAPPDPYPAPVITAPSQITGTSGAAGTWFVDFGGATGTVTWIDPNGTARALGDTATLTGWTVTVRADGTIAAARAGGDTETTYTGTVIINAVNSGGAGASRSVSVRLRENAPSANSGGDAGPLAFAPLSFS